MNTYWYIVRVLPGKERQLTEHFNEKINIGNITNIKRFVCPIEKEFITIRNKKMLRDKVIYNGYLYYETENKLTEDELKHISLNEGFLSMAGSKLPQLMRTSDVNRIIKDDNIEEHVKIKLLGFIVGEKVQITNGPFTTFGGIIKEITMEKVTLEVAVFGRPTTVILDKEHIKKY